MNLLYSTRDAGNILAKEGKQEQTPITIRKQNEVPSVYALIGIAAGENTLVFFYKDPSIGTVQSCIQKLRINHFP